MDASCAWLNSAETDAHGEVGHSPVYQYRRHISCASCKSPDIIVIVEAVGIISY